MIDVTNRLASIEVPRKKKKKARQAEWTPTKLRQLLDDHGLPYVEHRKDEFDDGIKFHFAECVFCGESEGHPDAWIKDGKPHFNCQRATCGKKFSDFIRQYPPKLPYLSAADLPTHFGRERQTVIDGLIRRGDIMGLVGGPKSRKTWLAMQMALCVASGIDFLCWPTVRSRIRIYDNELRGDDVLRRMRLQSDALGLDFGEVSRNIDISFLRGQFADLNAMRNDLVTPSGKYGLVIIDSLYKAIPRGLDENSNSDMTRAYTIIDSMAEQQDCAVVAIHHLSKGSQKHKSVTDLGSGAGAQSRSVDVHFGLTPHVDENTCIAQAVLRSQRPMEPFCIEFRYPLWTLAEDKDTDAVQEPGRKKSQKPALRSSAVWPAFSNARSE